MDESIVYKYTVRNEGQGGPPLRCTVEYWAISSPPPPRKYRIERPRFGPMSSRADLVGGAAPLIFRHFLYTKTVCGRHSLLPGEREATDRKGKMAVELGVQVTGYNAKLHYNSDHRDYNYSARKN